jgi:hypothetical protein
MKAKVMLTVLNTPLEIMFINYNFATISVPLYPFGNTIFVHANARPNILTQTTCTSPLLHYEDVINSWLSGFASVCRIPAMN